MSLHICARGHRAGLRAKIWAYRTYRSQVAPDARNAPLTRDSNQYFQVCASMRLEMRQSADARLPISLSVVVLWCGYVWTVKWAPHNELLHTSMRDANGALQLLQSSISTACMSHTR